MMYRVSQPLAPTQFPGDDKKNKKNKKAKNKKIGVRNYTMKDLTKSQRKKIESVNLSNSAKQKAINAFVKENMKKNN